MPALTCYRLTTDNAQASFDDFLNKPPEEAPETLRGDGFEARLYLITPPSGAPAWASFLEKAFNEDASNKVKITESVAPSALLLIKTMPKQQTATAKVHGAYFAFPFGPRGRFLINSDRILRGYGLRTALNLIYSKKNAGAGKARLRSVDSKRHGLAIIRSRTQASTHVGLESFDVNPLRDMLGRATGTPATGSWDSTISGSDALSFSRNAKVQDLAAICRQLDQAYNRNDYKDDFKWIDNLGAVVGPAEIQALETLVLSMVIAGNAQLNLAPPEMLDWGQIAGFDYQPDVDSANDGDTKLTPVGDLSLTAYLDVLGAKKTADLSREYLQRARIAAVQTDGTLIKWSVWKCLVGDFRHGKTHYLLDEGRFFVVNKGYLSELDQFVDSLDNDLKPRSKRVTLPHTKEETEEGIYNTDTAKKRADLLLLDRRVRGIPGSGGNVEICDLLSSSRQLIHVKRHLGSATLSHLFAQGLVSAQLLQTSPEFRGRAADAVEKSVDAHKKFDQFNFFKQDSLAPSDFEVVYAIAAKWTGKKLAKNMPFFSKINLREATTNLRSRGFSVSVKKIHAK